VRLVRHPLILEGVVLSAPSVIHFHPARGAKIDTARGRRGEGGSQSYRFCSSSCLRVGLQEFSPAFSSVRGFGSLFLGEEPFTCLYGLPPRISAFIASNVSAWVILLETCAWRCGAGCPWTACGKKRQRHMLRTRHSVQGNGFEADLRDLILDHALYYPPPGNFFLHGNRFHSAIVTHLQPDRRS